jgi:peroxiredoxin
MKRVASRYKLLIGSLMAFTILHASGEVASYKESFDIMMERMNNSPSKFSNEEQKIMKNTGSDLAKSLPNPGIHVGEKAPNFSLKNAFGKEINLQDELKKGPVILVFYRGAWCPFCNMHLHALQESMNEFKKNGAQLIAITPQTPDKSVEQIKKDGYPFEVVSDLDNSVIKAYKLYFELPKELLEIYKRHGLDIESYNGENRTALPIPGTFVIDQKGIVRAMQADTDYKIRMEPQDILKALEKISKK